MYHRLSVPERRRVIKILAFSPRAGLRGAGVQSRAAVVTPLSWNLDPGFASRSLGFQVLCAQMLSRVRLFATLWTVARQAPLSMGFPRNNTGVGCHFLLQGVFPTQRWSLEWAATSFSRGSSRPSDGAYMPCVFCTGRQVVCC